MNNQITERVKSLPVSATLAMAVKTQELRAEGKDVIGLSLGEPDFNTPDYIKDAAIQAIQDNYNSYTPVDGYKELKEAIVEKFERDNGLTYKPSQIVVSTGAKQAIANTLMVLLNPGDEVILPTPYWVSYAALAKLCEATCKEIPSQLENDYKISPAQLEEAITPKTKLVFLNSPSNPSGSIYTEQEYRAFAKVLEKHPNIFVLSDEIYEHINYDQKPFSFAKIESMFERTITVNGLAKAFAMTGWRLGYLGAAEWIAKACTKLQGQITSGTNCIAQRAAITALKEPVSRIQYMVDEFKIRRDIVVSLLRNIEGFRVNVPAGAFYVFPDISHFFGKNIKGVDINNASDFSMFLLNQANVATVTGDAFGSPNCIRISYATSEEKIREALKRIKEAVS
jgi:aspartate aminotransferase